VLFAYLPFLLPSILTMMHLDLMLYTYCFSSIAKISLGL